MCHSSLEIEFGEWLNFITGQNGSNSLFLYICILVFNLLGFVLDMIACCNLCRRQERDTDCIVRCVWVPS